MRWPAQGAVALIVLAAACGSGSNPPGAATTINFWYVTSGAQEVAKAFQAVHPDIDVKATQTSSEKMLAAIKAGTGPDVVEVTSSWSGAMTKTGALNTSIPWFIDTRVVYYRADVLKDLNIDPANAFSNWEAFDHTLDAIKTAKKIAALGIAGKNDSNPVATFAPWIWEAGGSLVSDDGTRPAINQSAAVDGVDEYQRFGGRYVDAAVLQQDSAAVESMFVNGKFAVTIAGPSLALKLKGAQFGVQQFPPGHTGHAVYIGGSNLAVPKTTSKESAALELVKWLTGSEGQAAVTQKIGMFPANPAVQPNGPVKDQLAAGRTLPTTLPTWPAVEKTMATDLGKIWDEVIAEGQPMAKDVLQTLLDKTAADMQTALSQS